MENTSLKQIAFLLYDSRSGSTLFSALLNRFAGVCVAYESAFVSRIIEYRSAVQSPADIPPLIDYLYEEVQFAELGLPRLELECELNALSFPLSKKVLAETITETYFRRKDPTATHWVIKHNSYAYLPKIQAMFPGIKFLHIIRDGRAVYQSRKYPRSISSEPMDTNLVKAALRWRKRVQISKKYPGLVCEIRYEDLITRTQATLDTVLDYLDVPSSGRVQNKPQGNYFLGVGERPKHLHADVAKTPDEKKIESWRTGLDPIDIYGSPVHNGKLT